LPEKVRRKSALIIQNLHETGPAGARTTLGGAACASAALGCRSGRLGVGCGVGLEAAAFPVSSARSMTVAPSRSMTKGGIPNKLPTLSPAESMSCESGPSAFAGDGTASAGATALEERDMLTDTVTRPPRRNGAQKRQELRAASSFLIVQRETQTNVPVRGSGGSVQFSFSSCSFRCVPPSTSTLTPTASLESTFDRLGTVRLSVVYVVTELNWMADVRFVCVIRVRVSSREETPRSF
jgi:hypothetical protein